MKYFVALTLCVAVASAGFIKPTPITAEAAEIQEIIEAINSPSTNPATAAALEQMLLDFYGIKPEPISVGPAIIDFPLPDGGAVVEDVVADVPIVVAPGLVEAPAASAPLVQIILNINQASAEASPIEVAPVRPEPVEAPVSPIQIVDVMPVVVPAVPVDVVDVSPVVPVPVQPVDVVDVAPIPVSPVIIGTPIIPSPAVVLPEQLN